MRAAGRGRIVVVSSQGGARGMPAISAYSASKGALERWAESLAEEIAPFGLGVTILVSGTFKTDILTEQTPDYGDYAGPYAAHYAGIAQARLRRRARLANPPERFARALAKALDERAPFARHAVGIDATCFCSRRAFCPAGCSITSSVWRWAFRGTERSRRGPRAGSKTEAEPENPCRSSMPSDSTASACSSSAAPPEWAPRPPSWR